MTYAVDEADLRARIEAETPLGEAWRCLRCGAYVLGPPAGHGAAADAPVLLRGAALRAAFILRLLAIERWVRGVIIILLGIAVLRLKSAEVSLRQLVNDDLKSLQPFFNQIHFNVTDSGLIKSIQDTLDTKQSTLTLVGIALLVYGALQLAEGVGLWSLKRWGEYIAVVGTTLVHPARGVRADREGDLASPRRAARQHRGGGLPGVVEAAVRRARRNCGSRGAIARGIAVRGRRDRDGAVAQSGDTTADRAVTRNRAEAHRAIR